ncbi:pre-mRNA-splicing factor CWC25 isoform X3 [Cynara cardunculus var. scolymus]|uniref:pre-mRNA-splicing factor CWC25 isoform X3 n=1 Tax=Cynara cardunculus var. scolymus TaxID=59895 RepID=UPI000D629A18|nr:pre-mRNA-splicing factor CWC25 isoform X3 [Cynara cardunculus var. scolymus]
MDSDLHSPSNSAGAKAAFHKPSNDPSNRKYRRRSPVSGSSSSDGEPVRERSSTPARSWDDNAKHNDNRQRKDDRRDIDRDQKRSRYSRDGGSNRNADRRSYNDRRHDDYKRREKYAEEDQKNFHKSSPRTKSGSGSHGSYSDHARREFEQNRSRDNVDKHSRDRSDGSGHRSRDRDREASSLEYQKKYKDSSSDRGGSGKRQTNFKAEEVRSGEGDKHKKDDAREEKRDYPRTLKDGKSESLSTHEEPRGHRSGHHHKDTSWRDSKELDDPKYTRDGKGKSYDQEPRGLKDRHFKEPRELLDDKKVLATKKSKFSMDKDTEYSKDAIKHATISNEVQSSSLKQGQNFVGKANAEQDCVKESDIDAAKIAAMKAAELGVRLHHNNLVYPSDHVNRNLIGTGFMSTDQKKKLLWGSKKSTATEEGFHGNHHSTILG